MNLVRPPRDTGAAACPGQGRRAGRAIVLALALALAPGLGGCAVAGATAGAAISVTGAVVSTGVGLAGKAVGAGIDAASARPDEHDGSGIVVRERIRPAPGASAAAPRCAPAAGDDTPPTAGVPGCS